MIYAGLTQDEIDATIQAAAKDFYDILFQHLTAKNAAAKNPAAAKLLQTKKAADSAKRNFSRKPTILRNLAKS